ncbi:hypothetical protein BG011_005284 [Mortierella polycephala]|uniref:Uncharacterized protein n=1 Tax=Mortierella polycephala TaxID=41804 RepID=A0A9P6PXN3_9FUNG|nr:hypothetical protein BG011_005284 [Mortierella polycephala]
MTKRSPTATAAVEDVDMKAVDQSAKKTKVDNAVYAYPKDEYTVHSDFLKNSRFEVLYMATRARAEPIRYILEYVGANYSSDTPVDWPKGKTEAPFGCLPLLTHFKPDGTNLTIPEVPALCRYIGRLFGLVGETLEEDAIVDACFHAATDNVLNVMMTEIWMKPDPTDKQCINTAFEKMTPFFDGIEKYLVKNGSNGYLLRESTTYAEFPWYDWLQYFYADYPENMKTFVSDTVRPATRKLFERLDSNPRIRAYIDGGRWEYRPAAPLVGLYSTGVFVKDWERAFEFYSKTLSLECVLNVQPAEGGRYMEFITNAQARTKLTVYCLGKDEKFESNGNTDICFSVRSVQETHDRLVKKGVVFKMPPTKLPWGEMAQLIDPEGNTLAITGI